jgi:DNA-binding MarR family transcriptional regulator
MNETNEHLRDSMRMVGSILRRHRPDDRKGNYPDTQNRALCILEMSDGLSQSQLSYLLGSRPQSAGELIAKMERSGWVTRRPDENDSRINRVYLTEEGRRQAQLVASAEGRDDVLDCLDEQEKQNMIGLLDKIIASVPESEKREEVELRMPPRFERLRPRMEARPMPFVEDRPDHRRRDHTEEEEGKDHFGWL